MVDEIDVPNYNNLPTRNCHCVRPFDDGNFILNLMIDVLNFFGEKCQEAVNLCQNIPLSR